MSRSDQHFPEIDDLDDRPHDCGDSDCALAGVGGDDLRQLAFSMAAMEAAAPSLKLATYKTDAGLYVLLVLPYHGTNAVVGALYAPGLLAAIRASGYTVDAAERLGGVN